MAASPDVGSIYDELSGKEPQIRLLQLFGQHEGLLKFDMTTFPLYDAPKFAALSYCWGEENTDNEILINGQPWPVWPNLFDFLKIMAQHDQHEWLWIDAVCINQSSNAEKSKQVQHMGDLYRRAEYAIVWLGGTGPLTDGEEKFDAMTVVLETIYSFHQTGDLERLMETNPSPTRSAHEPHRMLSDDNTPSTNGSPCDATSESHNHSTVEASSSSSDPAPVVDRIPSAASAPRDQPELTDDPHSLDRERFFPERCHAIHRLAPAIFGSEYWTRLWIVQELIMARRVIYRYKTICVSEMVLAVFADCINTFNMKLGKSQADDYGLQFDASRASIDEYLAAMEEAVTVLQPGERPTDYRFHIAYGLLRNRMKMHTDAQQGRLALHRLVGAYAVNQECRNPRDKIFGLLAMSQSQMLTNYNISIPQLYLRVLVESIIEIDLRARTDEAQYAYHRDHVSGQLCKALGLDPFHPTIFHLTNEAYKRVGASRTGEKSAIFHMVRKTARSGSDVQHSMLRWLQSLLTWNITLFPIFRRFCEAYFNAKCTLARMHLRYYKWRGSLMPVPPSPGPLPELSMEALQSMDHYSYAAWSSLVQAVHDEVVQSRWPGIEEEMAHLREQVQSVGRLQWSQEEIDSSRQHIESLFEAGIHTTSEMPMSPPVALMLRIARLPTAKMNADLLGQLMEVVRVNLEAGEGTETNDKTFRAWVTIVFAVGSRNDLRGQQGIFEYNKQVLKDFKQASDILFEKLGIS